MWWRTKFADTNTIPQQLEHIKSELDEIHVEYAWVGIWGHLNDPAEVEEAKHRMKQEALDLIQSTYTLLHILGMTEREHDRMKWEMEVKNHQRGYYKKESPGKG